MYMVFAAALLCIACRYIIFNIIYIYSSCSFLVRKVKALCIAAINSNTTCIFAFTLHDYTYILHVSRAITLSHRCIDTSREDFGIILSRSVYTVSARGITATQHAQAKAHDHVAIIRFSGIQGMCIHVTWPSPVRFQCCHLSQQPLYRSGLPPGKTNKHPSSILQCDNCYGQYTASEWHVYKH